MPDGESQFNDRPKEKLKQRFITHRSWGKRGMPQGATWGGQGRVQTEPQHLGYMPLLGSLDNVLWGSKAKARLVNSNQKSTALVSCMGVLSKHKGKPLGGWVTVDHKGSWKSHIRNLTFACDSEFLSKACIYMRGQCWFKSPAGHLAKQNGRQGSNTMKQLS